MTIENEEEEIISKRRAAIAQLFQILFVPAIIILIMMAIFTGNEPQVAEEEQEEDLATEESAVENTIVAAVNQDRDEKLTGDTAQPTAVTDIKPEQSGQSPGAIPQQENIPDSATTSQTAELQNNIPSPSPETVATNTSVAVDTPAPQIPSTEPTQPTDTLPLDSKTTKTTSAQQQFTVGKEVIYPNQYKPAEVQALNVNSSLIAELVSRLNECPGRIVIVGHSDTTGEDQSNAILSKLRADNVLKVLSQHGLQKSASTEGAGSKFPLGDNSTSEGRNKNRRVAIQCRKAAN